MPDAPHLVLSAGDTSGDQHAARLLRRLQQLLPGLSAEGLGGPELAAAGCTLHEDLVRESIFGISGAVKAVPHLLGVLRRTAGILDARRPDAVIIVDYPGLNLYVARLAAARGIPVIYFVAPQLWAWAPWRVRRFARVLDEALVIFPFEVAFWRDAGVPATFIGHPLLDALPRDEAALAAARDPAITAQPRPVALLPGSRPREVRDHMPLFLQVARRLLDARPDATFHAAHVSGVERANIEAHARAAGVPLQVHGDRVHAVMASCRCALVASGTATLETALLGTPLVLTYSVKASALALSRLLAVTPYIGMVNLVAGRGLAPELILRDGQPDAAQRLADALLPLLDDSPEWRAQKDGIEALRRRSAGFGAIERAAQHLAARLGRSAAPASGDPGHVKKNAPSNCSEHFF
ncbi:MAG TPA: lipid-A-disaccharide synthase [Planctomycetota bacterium]|nr:lipid-A-disaccharide synthase [Planctomycetota bacterium]